MDKNYRVFENKSLVNYTLQNTLLTKKEILLLSGCTSDRFEVELSKLYLVRLNKLFLDLYKDYLNENDEYTDFLVAKALKKMFEPYNWVLINDFLGDSEYTDAVLNAKLFLIFKQTYAETLHNYQLENKVIFGEKYLADYFKTLYSDLDDLDSVIATTIKQRDLGLYKELPENVTEVSLGILKPIFYVLPKDGSLGYVLTMFGLYSLKDNEGVYEVEVVYAVFTHTTEESIEIVTNMLRTRSTKHINFPNVFKKHAENL